jgi:hypothetical protein
MIGDHRPAKPGHRRRNAIPVADDRLLRARGQSPFVDAAAQFTTRARNARWRRAGMAYNVDSCRYLETVDAPAERAPPAETSAHWRPTALLEAVTERIGRRLGGRPEHARYSANYGPELGLFTHLKH